MAAIRFVLTQPPHPGSCFVEVETDDGRSVSVGQWRHREDGLWELRVTADDVDEAVRGVDRAHAEQRRRFDPLLRSIRGQDH